MVSLRSRDLSADATVAQTRGRTVRLLVLAPMADVTMQSSMHSGPDAPPRSLFYIRAIVLPTSSLSRLALASTKAQILQGNVEILLRDRILSSIGRANPSGESFGRVLRENQRYIIEIIPIIFFAFPSDSNIISQRSLFDPHSYAVLPSGLNFKHRRCISCARRCMTRGSL